MVSAGLKRPAWPVDPDHREAIDTVLVMAEAEDRWGESRRASVLLDNVERIVGTLPQPYERSAGAVAAPQSVDGHSSPRQCSVKFQHALVAATRRGGGRPARRRASADRAGGTPRGGGRARAGAARGAASTSACRSPKLRALQTAQLACEPLGVSVTTSPALAGEPFDVHELTAGLGEVLLVGHDPSFSLTLARPHRHPVADAQGRPRRRSPRASSSC